MSDPHIISTKPYSDSVVEHTMSDGTTFFGCSWPGCHYVAPAVSSVSSHYKVHSGAAAQKRRAARRPRTAVQSDIADTALALVDLAQALLDKVDAMEADQKEIREKAERWDALVQQMRDG